jgi:hypothetical protein
MREKRDCRRDPAFAKLQHPTGNAAQDQEGGDHKKKLNYSTKWRSLLIKEKKMRCRLCNTVQSWRNFI